MPSITNPKPASVLKDLHIYVSEDLHNRICKRVLAKGVTKTEYLIRLIENDLQK